MSCEKGWNSSELIFCGDFLVAVVVVVVGIPYRLPYEIAAWFYNDWTEKCWIQNDTQQNLAIYLLFFL